MNIKISKLLVNSVFVSYKALSSILPHSCRFYPSCSEYSRKAINEHGLIKGLGMTLRRVLKCNPLFPGGYDPVK